MKNAEKYWQLLCKPYKSTVVSVLPRQKQEVSDGTS